ncbi:MAG: hypothetical protein WC752_00135 [Patescibacteria group bacterium]|jgi:hypothetical protein
MDENNLTPNFPSQEAPQQLPLTDVNIENIEQTSNQYLLRHPFYIILPAGALLLIILLSIFLKSYYPLYLILFILFLVSLFYTEFKNRHQQEFMKQFAAQNNFTYNSNGYFDDPNVSLFKLGSDKYITNLISGNYKNCPFSLYNYQYTIRSGKHSMTYYYTIFSLHFHTTTPAFLLESKKQQIGHALFDTHTTDNYLQLEGNFNDYFSLSMPKGYERDVLQILTPDVMAKLIDEAKYFSMEIINDHLYLYAKKTISTKQDLYAFYELAQYFIEKLAPILRQMKPTLDAKIM